MKTQTKVYTGFFEASAYDFYVTVMPESRKITITVTKHGSLVSAIVDRICEVLPDMVWPIDDEGKAS